MQRQSNLLVLDSTPFSIPASLKRLTMSLQVLLALSVSSSLHAQNLEAEPLFGATSLQAGFSDTPFTVEISPGGEDGSWELGSDCYGYIRFAQPDYLLSYEAGDSPLGVFALSDLDITLVINDPAGNWHCNDDSNFLNGTNSGIQFDRPLSGDYQIWVGSYEGGAESIATLLAITEADETEWAAIPIGLEDAIYAASFDLNGDIVFGDDSSGFANDGECDDPRFQGPGVVFGSSSSHIFKDASDCRAQFEAGTISLAEPGQMNLGGNNSMDSFAGGGGLFDGDSPVNSTTAMADAGPVGEVMFALMQAFAAIPGDDAPAMALPFGLGGDTTPDYDRAAMLEATGIDFGDDSGPFTTDGECDDPRFAGPGVAASTFEGAEFTDASDCSSLYMAGALTYSDPDTAVSEAAVDSSAVNFGDNSGMFTDDGECDDPRFEGPGSAAFTSEASELRDANDCRRLFEAGRVSLAEEASTAVANTATSTSSNRNSEPAAAREPEPYTPGTPRGDVYGATLDDGSIFASGTVYGGPINPGERSRVGMPDTAAYVPPPIRRTATGGIDFGDNSSAYANDGECDDPRFEGEGMAFISFDEDLGKDANDCRAAFEAGTITLIQN
jgi:hypothetical protein